MKEYTELLLRILNAKEKSKGLRLSNFDIELLYMALFDAIDRQDLLDQLEEFK